MAISGKTCNFTTQYGIVRYGMEQLVKKKRTVCLIQADKELLKNYIG